MPLANSKNKCEYRHRDHLDLGERNIFICQTMNPIIQLAKLAFNRFFRCQLQARAYA